MPVILFSVLFVHAQNISQLKKKMSARYVRIFFQAEVTEHAHFWGLEKQDTFEEIIAEKWRVLVMGKILVKEGVGERSWNTLLADPELGRAVGLWALEFPFPESKTISMRLTMFD